MTVRVFQYGLLPPRENGELVRAQMRAAHNYRNRLTEIERARRAALREAQIRTGDVASLEAAVKAAAETLREKDAIVKALRSHTRAKSETADARQAVADARQELRRCRAAFAEARYRLREDPEALALFKAVDEVARGAQLAARLEIRRAASIYWGSYLLVEAAADASRKMPLYRDGAPNDPRFLRWAGEGRVGVQIQYGIPTHAVFGTDTRLHIDAVDERAWSSPSRGERRRLSRTTLRMRVGSTPDRKPIWASWPMVMHRPLPDTGRIKNAVVSLRKEGPRERWMLHITVEDHVAVALPPPNQEAVAIDLGWRIRPDGVRVGMWRGTDGASGEVLLPKELESGFDHAEELQSIRDKNFTAAKGALLTWLQTATDIPEWMTEARKYMHLWESPARLAGLVRHWRDHRWPEDGAGYTEVEAWRYHDYHLWTWLVNHRRKTLGWRRELYRIAAADFAKRYGILVLEDLDLSKLSRKQKTEDVSPDNKTARKKRVVAAPGEFQMALINAFSKRGEVAFVPPQNTTRTCHTCGTITTFDQATFLHHACEKCKTVWDQDDNAAANLLTLWRERAGGDTTPAPARTTTNTSETEAQPQSKWARTKKRKAQLDTARNPPPNHAE